MKKIQLDQESFDNVTAAIKSAAPYVERQQQYEQTATDMDIPEVVAGLKSAGVVAEADVADTIEAIKTDPALALKLLKSAAKLGGRVQVLGASARDESPRIGDDAAKRDSKHLSILKG